MATTPDGSHVTRTYRDLLSALAMLSATLMLIWRFYSLNVSHLCLLRVLNLSSIHRKPSLQFRQRRFPINAETKADHGRKT
jgi:hypothetical protein